MDTLKLYEDSVSTLITPKPPIAKLVERTEYALVFQGIEIPVTHDTLETLEDLKDCDGFLSVMTFYGCEFSEKMLEAGLIKQNVRGSHYCTALFNDVYEQLCEKTLELYKTEIDVPWTPTPENIEALPEPIREYIESLKRMHD